MPVYVKRFVMPPCYKQATVIVSDIVTFLQHGFTVASIPQTPDSDLSHVTGRYGQSYDRDLGRVALRILAEGSWLVWLASFHIILYNDFQYMY